MGHQQRAGHAEAVEHVEQPGRLRGRRHGVLRPAEAVAIARPVDRDEAVPVGQEAQRGEDLGAKAAHAVQQQHGRAAPLLQHMRPAAVAEVEHAPPDGALAAAARGRLQVRHRLRLPALGLPVRPPPRAAALSGRATRTADGRSPATGSAPSGATSRAQSAWAARPFISTGPVGRPVGEPPAGSRVTS